MLFTKEIVVIANTSELTPNVSTLKIAHGVISKVSVCFPLGCSLLVDCVIVHHEHQVFPSTENMSLVGDGEVIEWNEYYECYQPPYELKVKCWSEGTSYNHTIVVRVAILPRKAIVALAVADAIRSLFGLLTPKRISVKL